VKVEGLEAKLKYFEGRAVILGNLLKFPREREEENLQRKEEGLKEKVRGKKVLKRER